MAAVADRDVGCVLHIGLPKTATTTLQAFLFPEHSQVFFLGRRGSQDGRPVVLHRSDAVRRLFAELLYDNWRNPDLGLCRELIAAEIAPARARGLVPVYSWESLVEDRLEVRRARAERLREAFGRCTVIVALRHPLRLVESLYLQLLRRDNWGAEARRGRAPRFETIGDWLERSWGRPGEPPSAQLEYPETLEAYAEVFGRDDVHVMLFEDLVEDPDAYLRRLCGWIGIDADEGLRLTRGRQLNDRVGAEELARLEAVVRSPLQRLWFRLLDPGARRRLLGAPERPGQPSTGAPARPQTPPEWIERIADTLRPGHRRLLALWSLDLARHGYPL